MEPILEEWSSISTAARLASGTGHPATAESTKISQGCMPHRGMLSCSLICWAIAVMLILVPFSSTLRFLSGVQ